MAYRHLGPIETLNHAWRARVDLWVLCRGCGHARRLKPGHLVVDRGEMSLAKLREKFVCRRCKARRAAIVLHDEPGPGR
jgi:ribosomal protein L40E